MSVTPQPANDSTPVPWRDWLIALISAALAGIAATAAVWLYSRLHNGIYNAAFGPLADALQQIASWAPALIPALGGVIIALVIGWMMKGKPLPGFGHVIYSVAAEHGKLPWYRGLAYMVGAVISLGFGIPVGADVPAAMAGAYLSSWGGQRWRARAELLQALVISGIAAGIAYNYGAHVAGALFALEITYGGFGNWRIITASLIGASMAAIATVLIGPANPVYQVPADAVIFGGGALIVYIGLALVAGVVGTIFIRLLATASLTLAKLPLIGRAALVGLIIGVISLFVPGILGSGVSTAQSIFSGQSFTVTALLVILFGRLVLVPVAMRNGFNGGVIGPSLVMGAALGSLAAQIVIPLFPGIGLTPLQLELVGAAAVVAATTRGAVFATILIVEMTGSISFMGPVLLAVASGYLLSQRLDARSAYTFGFPAWGIRMTRGGHTLLGTLTPAAHAAGVVPDEAGRP